MMQEKEVARRMFDDISPDDVVADVGANVGIYSSFIVRQVKSGLVLCFEPEPKTQARLCQNLELNSSDDNWRIVGLALSDSAGTTTLETTGDEIGEGGHRFSEDGDFTVRTERMDELFAKGDIPQPTVVKMDVEGAEYLVLRGMERLLSNVRSLYIEVHPGEIIGGDFDDIQHLLERNGFEIQNLGKRSEIFHIVATNTRVSQ
jgi:FkbM family methyltransferase